MSRQVEFEIRLITAFMNSKTIPIKIESSVLIQADPSSIFAIVSNHEGTPDWVDKVKKVKLLKTGTPKNGLGAIREVHFKPLLWGAAREEIVAYEQDSHFHYKVISSLPGMIDHLGMFQLTPQSDGMVKVEWKIHFVFKQKHWFRYFLKSFAKQFKAVQEDAFAVLKGQLER